MLAISLRPGSEDKIRNGYPWAYREDLLSLEPGPPGEIVEVHTASGEFLALAFYNSTSHIPLRILSLTPGERIDRHWLAARISAAAAGRAGRILNTDAYRIVHAEADGLPGLIVDRLGPALVIQLRNPGMDRFRAEIVRALKKALAPVGIYERSDVEARVEEGLPPQTGLLWGETSDPLTIFEDDLFFTVSISRGQKTGFYLDQRDNRRLFRSFVGPGAQVLDVYSYTGAFGLHAARMGAHVLAVDKDSQALTMLETNARANDLSARIGVRLGDALTVMQDLSHEKRLFSHIVLDPPTLVRHKQDVPRIKRLFISMAEHALALLAPGGLLWLSTCAYHLSANDLVEVARLACRTLRRRAQVITITYQPADHPWILQIPETLYLKSLVLRVA